MNLRDFKSLDQMTKVVNVKVAYIRPRYNDLRVWMNDPNNVYIGRAGIVFVNTGDSKERCPKTASKWANPFAISATMTREMSLEQYETYIRDKLNRGEIKVEELLALEGKQLGCWCKPEACHGDVLVLLIAEYSLPETLRHQIYAASLEELKTALGREIVGGTLKDYQRTLIEGYYLNRLIW